MARDRTFVATYEVEQEPEFPGNGEWGCPVYGYAADGAHWENRRLRVPEPQRLFPYPDDFAFVGRRGSIQAQIGSSVPPLLARQVAQQVAESKR
jgi:site-specific DNA-cytosine methylase